MVLRLPHYRAATLAVAFAAAVIASPLGAQVRTPPKKPPAVALPAPTAPALPVAPAMPGALGIVADSLHGGALIGAMVIVEGTNRTGKTDENGRFRIDSIPPGEHRISITHVVLDSISIALGTPPIAFESGKYAVVSLAIPSPETIAGLYCPAVRRVQGPSVVIGRVLDADTDKPMVGAKLSLLWEELVVNKVIGVRKVPRVRTATTDSLGVFSICGVPDDMNAHLQASRDSILTADIPIEMDRRVLATAIIRIASPAAAVAVVDSTRADTSRNRPMTLRRGSAILTGRVTNLGGVPISGARVDVPGTPAV
ncbi:MAG: carboxypeptidase-like regulatory domain-containing protein, partial [Gemmatimonadota bacterium]|nr:carboxypeptidase-like regulatory domain-containing protein [Gemmatimonadota bacterium]